MDEKESLELSIEKHILVLADLDVELDYEKFQQYQGFLNECCYAYRQNVLDRKIEDMRPKVL